MDPQAVLRRFDEGAGEPRGRMSALDRSRALRRRWAKTAACLPFIVAVAACRGSDEPALAPQPLAGSTDFALASPNLDYTHADLAAGRDREGEALCLTWLAFDGQRDAVYAAVHGAGGWQKPERLSEGTNVHFPPRVASDPSGGFYIVWAARTNDAYALFGRQLRDGNTGALETLTDGAGNDGEPVLASSRDAIWLAWESFRDGGFDVWARRRDGTGWGDPIRVTDHPRSDLQPSVAVDASGAAWVAFVSWRDGDYASGNYEIYAARVTADSAAAAPDPVRLSRSRYVDMFPELLSVGGEICAFWTEAYFPARRIEGLRTVAYTHWKDKLFQMACLGDQGWSTPRDLRVAPNTEDAPVPDERATPVAVSGPQASARQEVWLLHGRLVSRGPTDRSWATHLLRLGKESTSAPVDLSGGTTHAGGRLGAAWLNGRLWTAETLVSRNDGRTWNGHTWVRVRSIDASDLPPEEPAPRFEIVPRDAPEPAVGPPVRTAGIEVRHGTATWQAYFGNLHDHSDFSRDRRGNHGSAVQSFRSVYDVAALDFGGLSDHIEWLLPVDWWEIRKVTDLWNRPGDFVALTSYEWTSLEHGHRNLFFPGAAVESGDMRFDSTGATPDDLWRFLGERPAIAIPHHPSHALREPMDWSYRNDRFQRLVEIFQNRGSYEYDGAPYQVRDRRAPFREGHSVRHALGLGHRLGIIASPDHGGGMGLAGAWAEGLTRDSIFEALHARRTFGTTGAKMELFLSVAGEPQGSEIHAAQTPVTVAATVRATVPGLDLVLVVDGIDAQSWHFDGDRASLEWQDTRPLATDRYYYLRVHQGDGHMAWTSPVWISNHDHAAPSH